MTWSTDTQRCASKSLGGLRSYYFYYFWSYAVTNYTLPTDMNNFRVSDYMDINEKRRTVVEIVAEGAVVAGGLALFIIVLVGLMV